MAHVFDTARILGRVAASQGNGGPSGGSVDDIQKRLTAVEKTQAETKVILQNVATKTELAELRGEMRAGFEKINARFGEVMVVLEKLASRVFAIESLIPHLATKADVLASKGEAKTDTANLRTELKTEIAALRTDIAELHVSIIKWTIGTALTSTALACTIIKVLDHVLLIRKG